MRIFSGLRNKKGKIYIETNPFAQSAFDYLEDSEYTARNLPTYSFWDNLGAVFDTVREK